MAGNQEVTDLPQIPAVDGADVYAAKNNLDYRIRTGEPGGLATLDGTGKLPTAQMPNFGSLTLYNGAVGVQSSYITYGKNNNVPRWISGIEAGGDFTFYGYDTSGLNGKILQGFTYSNGVTSHPSGDLSVGATVGQGAYSAWGRAIVIQSSTNTALELVSTRPDAAGALLGVVSANYRTNQVNHQRVAEIQLLSSGANATQRGGRISFQNKPNGTTALVERMSIDQDGAITVNGFMTVTGTVSSTGGDIKSNQNFTSNTATVILANTGAGNVYLRPNGVGSTSGEVRLDSAGNFFSTGIYHTDRADGNWALLARNTGGAARGGIWVDGAGIALYNSNFVTSIHFGNTGTTTIAGSNVSITGATAISANMSAFQVTSTGGAFIGHTGSAVLAPGSSGGVYLRPNGAGNSAGECVVNTSGVVTAANFVATSDRELKTDIKPKEARRNLADKLNLVSFIWKSTGVKDQGLIAQEVEALAPEYVHINDEGVRAIDKVGLLLECVVDLAARVKELEGGE